MKISKIVDSRKKWKEKAKGRGSTIRQLRKGAKNQKRQDSEKLSENDEIRRLTEENAELRALLDERKLPLEGDPVIQQKCLCVIILICGIVSFRSVPRIMRIFQPLLRTKVRIPHFTSVINWTLRAGIAIFSNVSTLSEPWLALIDCSIDIGTRKALVVLRVKLSALHHKKSAIGLGECECIGMEISHSWNGQLVSEALTRVFEKTGLPVAIIKDGGTDLKKGVDPLCERNPDKKIHLIDDVGHFTANLLKALFAGTKAFTTFLKIVSTGAARIRQTNLAWLLPPKIRTKGRFQGITGVANWAQKLLTMTSRKGNPTSDPDATKARNAFVGLAKLRPFLTRFCNVCSIAELFLELMKTKGLNENTYAAAKDILVQLPARSLLRTRLSGWLEKHINIYRLIGNCNLSLPVSSDPIESLFGKFKTIIQRNPQAELNRLMFVIPLLCGNHSLASIDHALTQCSHAQMLTFIQNNVPETLRELRIKKMPKASTSVPKSGKRISPETG